MNRFVLPAVLLGAFSLSALLPAQLRRVPVATGLTSPLYVTHAPGDSRLFIVEQAGVIKILEDGNVLATPFLNIVNLIASGGERGLLGLAFSPNYDQNGWFYVSYTRRPDGASILERYSVSAGDPDVADPNSGLVMQNPISQPFGNHNGGCIQFSPVDGFLYYGLGDGGDAGDPGCRSQNRQNLLGKMLRLDVDNHPNIVPPSNPFVGDASTHDKIWALGLRNPWRFSFDRANGDLYTGDVGQNRIEEIDYQPGTSTGGENYGWNSMEGNSCFGQCPGAPPCNSPLFTNPIHDYVQGANGRSVTGGYVYRGCGIPSMQGQYWFGDFISGRVWSFLVVNGQMTGMRERTNAIGGPVSNLASFGEDADGELYIVSLSGTVFKIVAGVTTFNDLGFGTPGSNGLVPSFDVCGLLTPGQSAEFRLDDAAPNQPALLAVGLQNNPTNFPGIGTIVPIPVLFAVPFMTDNDGQVRFSLAGGTGAATVYAQWGVNDPGAPNSNLATSNALEIFFQ